MGGPPFEASFSPRGHGPSSFGGAGSQFPPGMDDIYADFSKLDMDDKKEKEGGFQRSKSTRRVSFNISKGAPKRYEYYSFTKSNDWRVADRIKIAAPQEELERTVAKAKKGSSVLEAMKKMSPERRAQIDRLVQQKNLNEEGRDALWQCVYIDSPISRTIEVDGKRIREHKKMDVIIAQPILSGRARSSSQERSRSFAGERSDIGEPLKPKDKVKNKDKHSKDGKESKEGKDPREDPFDRKRLFNDHGVPLDRHGSIPEYAPQQLPFDPGMGQPFGPPRGQHIAPFQPHGPADNQMFGHLGRQPTQGQKVPHGIEIISDPIPPQPGANGVFNINDLLLPGPGKVHPHHDHRQPHFQQPPINGFDGAGAPHNTQLNQPFNDQDPPNAPRGRPSNQPYIVQGPPNAPHRRQLDPPFIIQEPPKGRPHYTNKWMNDDSSHESDDEFPFFDDDERSSHTSYGDDHEKLIRRGSLVPHRRSSTKRREPTYREHHRGASYPIETARPPEPRRDTRYHGDRVETIIERPRRRHSSRERREAIRYAHQQPPPPPPRRLEYRPRSPPLTPLSNSSYSPSRRFSGLQYPHEVMEREREKENERLAEDYMLGRRHSREKEEGRWRRERERERERDREAEGRDFFESSVLDRLGARIAGHDRYRSPR